MYTTVSGAELMPRVAKNDGPTDTLCTRLSAEETERWIEILRRARQRDPRAARADIIRALIGFSDARTDLLSQEDMNFFRGVSHETENVDPETRQREAMKRLIFAKAKTTPDPIVKRKKVSNSDG